MNSVPNACLPAVSSDAAAAPRPLSQSTTASRNPRRGSDRGLPIDFGHEAARRRELLPGLTQRGLHGSPASQARCGGLVGQRGGFRAELAESVFDRPRRSLRRLGLLG